MLRKISVAPLFNYTDRHCRYFYSLFSKYIKLYTGMFHTSVFLNKYKKNNLLYNKLCIPVGIQFAGNNTKDLYKCAIIANKLKFNEINFNLGCPSLRAKKGLFGAFLMSKKKIIIDCLNSIKDAVPNLPVTVKHRLSYKNKISYNYLVNFIGDINYKTKCNYFIIHASNICNLKKKNNNYDKLKYNIIYKLKKTFPNINIIINGGIKNIYDIHKHLSNVNGVMIGRGIYNNPSFLIIINYYLKNKFFLKKKIKIDNKYINKFLFNKNKINVKLRYILYKMYNYIKIQKKNIKIFYHMVFLFKNFTNSGFFRKRLILSYYYFNKFFNYFDFENFIFNY